MALGSWRARKQRHQLWKFKFLSNLSTGMLFLVFGGLFLVIAAIVYFATQVPSPDSLESRDIAQATKIYDRNNQLLYDIYQNQNRTPVKLDAIPNYVKQATIAIEDKNFYSESGFSLTGYGRALFDLVIHRKISGGGSTLTQQLVKNALLSGEQTLPRKIKELILAIQVERVYNKDQILEMYLNEIPYGGTAYGIEAAANLYFGEHASELDLAQASLLAGLPQRPSVYSPYGTHPELAKTRQKEVLNAMVDQKYITKSQADAAYSEKLTYRTSQNEEGFKAPHFVLYVKQKLIEQFGDKLVEQGGLRVTTTLDENLQEDAQKILTDNIAKLKNYQVGNGAAIIEDPKTGQVMAMVGSKDYFGDSEPAGCTSGVNCVFDPNENVVLDNRQPGSATKPITYALGIKKGYTAATVLEDVQTNFPGGFGQPNYTPVNYDGKFRGPIQVRYALANSVNIPAVKMLAMVGVKDDMDLAYRMGLSNWEPTQDNVNNVGLSLTLGGREVTLLDMATAFTVFANQGTRHDPVSILKVTDSSGKTLYEYHPDDGVKVLEPSITYVISDILADNGARSMEFGTNSGLNIPGYTVSVKTGTTDEKRDNWAIGYTPSYLVGVWVGNNDRTPMNPVISSGITGATPIWHDLMLRSLKGKGNETYSKPDNVVQIDVDGLMGGQPHGGAPTRKEYFVKGTEPNAPSPAYQNLKVCQNNPHRLANDGESADQKDVIQLKEDDPTGANTWQSGIDQWVLTAPNPQFVGVAKGCSGIPGFSGGGGGSPINIVNVGNGANVPRTFDVLANVNSPAGVKKVTWMLDGAEKNSQTHEPYALHVEFPQGDHGSHTITVTLVDNNGGSFSTSIGVTVSL